MLKFFLVHSVDYSDGMTRV